MKERKDKILDVAVDLAEEGGFDNVRQRDVAAAAGVALGTLYKSFRSKEAILCAALARETELLERRMETNPAKGENALDRACNFFQIVTRALCRKPKYARAVVRAMASGEPELAKSIVAYQGLMNGLIIAALRGTGRLGYADATSRPPTENEAKLAFILQQLWFAALVGWSAELISQSQVVDQVRTAATLLIRGLEAAKP
jgi:AcrR family transcriptional regulator